MSNSAKDVYKIVDADGKTFELKGTDVIANNIQTGLSSQKGFKIYRTIKGSTDLLYTHP